MPKKILVVDDDEVLLETTRAILEREGYQVVVKHGAFGTAALVARERPDLVLLDVHMPGLSGDRLIAILRDEPGAARTAIVFHSSNDEQSLRRLAAEHGARGYVCKGDLTQLRVRVARYLAS